MRKVLVLAALTAGLGACGGVDPEADELSTLVRLQGVVNNPEQIEVRGDLRLAVVWFNRDPSGEVATEGAFRLFVASEDLPLSPSFPSGFTLSLRSPPPPGAINEHFGVPTGDDAGQADVDPALRFVPVRNARGLIVVYHDRNGNGALDLVDEGATEFVDDVVGLAKRAQLVWLEGPLPEAINVPKQQGEPSPGFNIIAATDDVLRGDVYASGSSYQLGIAAQPEAFDWRSAEEPIEADLGADFVFDVVMCKSTRVGCFELVERDVRARGDLPPAPSRP